MNLRPVADPYLVFAAVIYTLLLTIAALAGLLGIPLGVIFALSLGRYGYAVLRWVAQGRKDLLPPGMNYFNPIGERGLALHLLFFSLLAILFAGTDLFGGGPLGAALHRGGTLLVIVSFPASAAIMGLTANLTAALNPASIASVIGTFGARYALLLLGCGALVALSSLIRRGLSSGGSFPLLVISGLVAIWTALAIFALIGAMLREQRADFDIPGDVTTQADERRERELHADWQRTLDIAYASIRSGLVTEGYRTIRQLIEKEQDSVEVYRWVLNTTLAWEDASHGLQIGRRFIEQFVEQGLLHDALELYMQCRGIARDFSVPTAAAAALAGYARSIGRHGVADDLSAAEPVDR